MRLSLPCAAAAASLIGSFVLAGCASKETTSFPASPVPASLTEMQAMVIADEYLDDRDAPERYVASVEPFEEGKLVSFRSSFDAAARPPVQSRMVMVNNNGTVRELTFRKGNE